MKFGLLSVLPDKEGNQESLVYIEGTGMNSSSTKTHIVSTTTATCSVKYSLPAALYLLGVIIEAVVTTDTIPYEHDTDSRYPLSTVENMSRSKTRVVALMIGESVSPSVRLISTKKIIGEMANADAISPTTGSE